MLSELKEQALAAYDQGQLETAIALQRKVAVQTPEDAAELGELGRWLVFAGRYEEAVDPLQQAISLDTGLLESHRWLAFSLHALCRIGEARLVLEQAERAVHQGEDLSYVSRSYSLIGLEGEALRTIDRALGVDPFNGELWLFRASFLHALGRLTEAVQACEQALKINPLDDLAENNRRVFQAALTP